MASDWSDPLYFTGSVYRGEVPLALIDVSFYGHTPSRRVRIGTVLTSQDGRFRLLIESPGSFTRIGVELTHQGRPLLLTGTTGWVRGQDPSPLVLRVNPEPAALRADDPVEPSATTGRSVRGVVTHVDGTPISGVTVRARDKILRGDANLGTGGAEAESTTNSAGLYHITYASAAQALVVRVFSGSTQIGASQVLVDPASHERLDVTVDSDAFRLPSEYERMEELLTPFVTASTTWAELNGEDAALLALRSRLPVKLVERFIVAKRAAADLGLSEEIAYALVRELGPTSPTHLVQRTRGQASGLLSAAATRNYVPTATGEAGATAEAQLKLAMRQLSLDPDTIGGMGALLDVGSTPSAVQIDFIDNLITHKGDIAAFWDSFAAAHPDDAEEVDRAVQIGKRILNHAPTLTTINSSWSQPSPAEIAKRSRADWSTLTAAMTEIPAQIPGETLAIRKERFATLCADAFERDFPSERAVADLRRGLASDDEVGVWLGANPSFDLRYSAVPTSGLSTSGAARLRAYQRLYRISPSLQRAEGMLTLHGSGYESARAITLGGRSRLKTKIPTLTAEAASEIYGKSQQTVALATQLRFAHDRNLTRVGGEFVPAVPPAASVPGLPDYETLFGNTDFCGCEECRSIHGPAAYLTDLLAWLDARDLGDALDERRPDIKQILLSCDNTNIALPYVDLVNEILEDKVAGAEISPRDTVDRTTDDLLAAPQYSNPSAYTAIGAAVYPLALPYAADLHRSRVYLQHMGTSREELFETLHTTSPSVLERATERLGMSTLSRQICSADGALLSSALYGFENDDNLIPAGFIAQWTGTLRASVPEVLARLGLSFEQLLDLNVRYVNPGGAVVFQATDPCDVDTYSFNAAADLAFFSRLARFARLARETGWTPLDLDKLLYALGVSEVDDDALVALAEVRALERLLKLSPAELACLWGPVDLQLDRETRKTPVVPLYDRIFLNGALLPPEGVAWPFTLDEARTEISGTYAVDSVRAELQATMGVSEGDLDLLLTAAGVSASANLSIAVVTQLYRRVLPARGLGMSIADLTTAMGAFTFTVPVLTLPSALREFAERMRLLEASDLTVPRWRWLFADEDPGVQFAPTTDWCLDLLGSLRDAARPATSEARASTLRAHLSTKTGLPTALLEDAWGRTFSGMTATLGATLEGSWLDGVGDTTGPWADIDLTASPPSQLLLAALILHRIAGLAADLDLVASDLVSLPAVLTQLPVGGVGAEVSLSLQLSTLELFALRAQIPGTLPEFADLFAPLEEEPADRDLFLSGLATRAGWDSAELIVLADALAFDAAALGTPSNLSRLLSANALVRRLGKAAATVCAWVTADPTAAQADEIVATARAAYPSPSSWATVARPLRNQLRDAQRDALVAFLIRGELGKIADDLWDELLIDTQMSPCQLTTRIKSATAAVQTFVQRCLLGLESGANNPAYPEIGLNGEDAAEWEWTKNFRVWEAARKVFLYPENWLEPEFRQDKSELFLALERGVNGGEITDEHVERQVISYLEGLHELSSLEPIALTYDEELDRLHLFARTPAIPRQLYYRTLDQAVRWSPWEKIPLDVQSDQLVACVAYNQVLLAWLTYTEAFNKEQVVVGLDFRLALALRNHEGWSAPRDCGVLTISVGADSGPSHRLHTEQLSTGTVRFHLSKQTELTSEERFDLMGYWELTPCTLATTTAAETGTCSFTGLGMSSVENAFLPTIKTTTTVTAPASIQISDITGQEVSVTLFDNGSATTRVRMLSDRDRLLAYPWFTVRQDSRCFLAHVANSTLLLSAQSEESSSSSSGAKLGSDPEEVHYETANPVDSTFTSVEMADLVTFQALHHPYVCDMLGAVRVDGIWGLYRPEVTSVYYDSLNRQDVRDWYFKTTLSPATIISKPYPVDDITFDADAAMGSYNWETFFHVPFYVANRLMKDQRFDEALKWWGAIFDPTSQETDVDAPMRYWRIKPFQVAPDAPVTDWAAFTGADATAEDEAARLAFEAQVAAWRADPFDPHLVAALRPGAYQRGTFMRYLDTLIGWGDQLFRRDTMESINEATQLYLYASKLLGPRPQALPQLEQPAKTYAELQPALDSFSNAIVSIENMLWEPALSSTGGTPIPTIGYYFCVPQNPKILGYWNTVADRLFKIRNCMNLSGQVRQLPLYEPPIDPALLVRASAMGLDLSTVLDGLAVPVGPYRFEAIHARAVSFCGTVQGLGGQLLAALEKKDAEAMSRLRQGHELVVLDAVRAVKSLSVDEAKRSLEAARKGKELSEQRQRHYQGLLDDGLLSNEQAQQDILAALSKVAGIQSGILAIAAFFTKVPDIATGLTNFALAGGSNLSSASSYLAASQQYLNSGLQTRSTSLGNAAGYTRRKQDWELQLDLAEKEIQQADKQILAAEIRLDIAQKDLANHDLQLRQSKEIEDFLLQKFTGEELYDWMTGQISALYFQAYDLAYRFALKAQQCYAFEIGDTTAAYIRGGHWDSLRKGLLAGECLRAELDSLEAAWFENNVRELELTKHVSLSRLDPLALELLRSTGECWFEVPEVLFDADCPGQYMRRIQSVAVSLACVAGPSSSVHAQLTLYQHSLRTEAPSTAGELTWEMGNTSIINSAAIQDSGVSGSDLRYQPFERLGAISRWKLRLTAQQWRQFDWASLTEVTLHLRYTARDGGTVTPSWDDIHTGFSDSSFTPQADGIPLALSAARDCADAWYLARQGTEMPFTLPLAALPAGVGISQIIAIPIGGTGTLSLRLPGEGEEVDAETSLFEETFYRRTMTPESAAMVTVVTLTEGLLSTLDDLILVCFFTSIPSTP